MDALGSGGWLWWNLPRSTPRKDRRRRTNSSSSESIDLPRREWLVLSDLPIKQYAIAGSLTVTGDTIAQLRDRFFAYRRRGEPDSGIEGVISALVSNHDWLRTLRMASYGYLIYGPGSYAWYQFLDHCMPHPTFINLSTKVILNQIALGPCVIAVIFAWNNLCLGKLAELPAKYQKDALPTLLYGFRFWIPVSIVNFALVPLSARVAFMATCSIFWSCYLSTTMSK